MALTKAPEELLARDLTSALTITTADNTTQLTLKSTDADSSSGPVLDLIRDSASPADSDVMGRIRFRGDNDAGEETTMVYLQTYLHDASDGTEDGGLDLFARQGGTLNRRITINSSGEICFNEDGADIDFRVEGDSSANAFFVEGSTNYVGIGTNDPTTKLEIYDGSLMIHAPQTTGNAWTYYKNTDRTWLVGIRGSQNDVLSFFDLTADIERMRIDSSGHVTMPSQSAFQFRKSAQQANITTGSNVDVTWDTQIIDKNSDFDATNNRFVAPVTGTYFLNTQIRFDNQDSAASYYQLHITTSNRDYSLTIDPEGFDSNNTYWTESVSVVADMDASDTAKVQVRQQGGSAQTDIDYGGSSWFSGHLLS